MKTIYNIRGTNGSGKTTLVKAFLPPNLMGGPDGGPVDLLWYKTKSGKDKAVEGYGNSNNRCLIVGPYRTATGGMDNIPSFELAQEAIRTAVHKYWDDVDHVLCEGILSSTVYGSWGKFAKEREEEGITFAFVYLQTPLEECLKRIKQRQIASDKVRDINEQLVADKVKAIASTRKTALANGHTVYDLPFDDEVDVLKAIMLGKGEDYRAR